MRWRLFLDDDRWPSGPIDDSWDWVVVRNFDDAVWYVENYGLPYYITFDHDLGIRKMTGMDFAVWLSEHIMDGERLLPDGFSYAIHSSLNPVGAANIRNRMRWLLDNYEENHYAKFMITSA